MPMLLVKTTLRPSEVHGLGLFADEFIPKGTVIWRFDGGVDRRYEESQLAALPAEEQERLFTFCYVNPGTRLYVYCGDNARYINHSEQPNTDDLGFEEGEFEGEGVTIAARDIQPGEEILSDYRSFDADARDGVI
jgi:SET domain-containing protein